MTEPAAPQPTPRRPVALWIALAIVAAAVLAGGGVAVGLAAGGSSKTATSASVTPAAAESTPTSSPSPSTTAAPMGTSQPTSVASATVYAYQQPVAAAAPRPQQDGYEWGAADVQVCAVSADIGASNLPWVLVYADSTQQPPSSVGYGQFPAPEYPWGEASVPRGRCVRGWITFAVPAGKRPAMVEYCPLVSPRPNPLDWAVA